MRLRSVLCYLALAAPLLPAQDTGRTVLLRSNLNPRIRRDNDQGPVAPETILSHLTVTLKRTPEQRAALDRLLAEQQDPASPNFQKRLTPEEFATRFGASDDTLNRLTAWLRSEGFTVESVARGRGWLVFNGTAAQIEATFHTAIRRYQVGARMHFAPSTAPSIPAQFENAVGAVRGLDDFYLEPPRRALPMLNLSNGTHALAPGDLTRIYDIFNYRTFPSAAQNIVVIGRSAVDLADIRTFRSTFQLPPNDPQTMLVGDDPGMDPNGGLQEADADIEWAGAVSRIAGITYVYAKDVFDAAQQAIDQNLAPILTFSFGACEPDVSSGDAAAIRDLAQQANAQGITWIASSGDAGAAACDQGSYPATRGLAVSFPASLPEVTGVGGTEFQDGPSDWQSFNSPDLSSAYGHIPEVGWNDTTGKALRASGGGASVLYPQPSWQTGAGVPANGARNVPDLAFAASPSHVPYVVFSGGKQYAAGGTSLAAPVFAGIMALAGQGNAIPAGFSGFGNINASLYVLAADKTFGPFLDVTSGNNLVPCQIGTPDCANGMLGYEAGPGYDQVTGLGSLDAYEFAANFRLATATTLTLPAGPVKDGAPATFTVTVRELTGRIPKGSVILNAPTYALSQQVVLDAAGTAVITVSLQGGPYTITANFNGAFPFMPSASPPASFFVIPPAPPAPQLGAPADKSTNVSVSPALKWNLGPVYALWDLYFGTTSPPPLWGSEADTTCFYNGCSPTGLAPNTTYYWKVVAKNVSGSAASPIWSFTTSSQPVYTISRIAGVTGKNGFSGDGGPATQATFNSPSDVIWDRAANLYIADTGNHRVRMVTPDGIVTTVVGTGARGASGDGGPAASATINSPMGLAFDSQGNLYISDNGAASVRMLAPDGTISTVAGGVSGFESNDSGPATSLPLYAPAGLVVDSADNLYIAEAECVRKVVAGIISTVAGQCGVNSGPSGDGGPATSAIVYRAQGIAMDAAGSLYIADTGNIDIRKVSNGTISSVSRYPANWLALDNAGNLFVTDAFYRVTKISSAADITIAGGGSYPLSSGISATSASLTSLGGLRVDSAGKITFADVSGVLVLTPLTGPPVASINPGGILNAASFSGGPLAPGSIATIFGNFGINATQAGGAPLPTVLSGVSIQMQTGSSISAPLFYASAGQVNLQIPWELAGQTSVPVSATLNGKSGPAQPLQLAPFAPGIFVVNRQGQGAIVNSSYHLVDSANPASAGDTIQIFCTGLGAVTNPPATGSPASGTTLSTTITIPAVLIGGVPATVLFSGLAPGAIGEYQVNVQVPAGVTPGPAVPVTISMQDATSNTASIVVQ